MKRALVLIAMLLLALTAHGQEKEKEKEKDYNTTRDFKNRVFEIRNRDPREIATAVNLLGSGFKGAGLNVNVELGTLTVRDFPENIAAIEEAIKRLDRPAAPAPDVVLKVSVLIGSKNAIPGAPAVPDDLSRVVRELQSTLRYTNFALMTANVHRTKAGRAVESSGVAESTALGMTTQPNQPIMYDYKLSRMSFVQGEVKAISVEDFSFGMRVPIDVGTSGVQYQRVGFNTPVTIRDGERVVIGTTTMGEKALIVVVTADLGGAKE